MRVSLLQLNPFVGDLAGNAALVEAAYLNASDQGADLCVTPELALTGYPPRDLLLYEGFARAAWSQAQELAARLHQAWPGGPPLLLGCCEENRSGLGKTLFNAALLLHGGSIQKSIRKALLPTYDVFDEARYFEPGQPGGEANLVRVAGVPLAVTICEDLWNDKDYWPHRLYPQDPLKAPVAAGAKAIINLSASPFCLGKQLLRQDMLSAIAKKHRLPLVYVNQYGGNDDLVFDGRSALYTANGQLAARAAAFAAAAPCLDLNMAPDPACIAADDFSATGETFRALSLGTRDYLAKCGFTRALLGLSGGIDSAVVACVAAAALGPENVLGVLMPSPWSSQGSISDSLALAKNLGIATRTLPIEPLMRGFDATLAEAFHGLPVDSTEENIQSRIRGNLLMALSNKTGAMLLTTGNKSELAVGYCTIYGDMSGGFALIADLPKTQVYALARHINQTQGNPIPEAVLTKAPSAELRPGQTDQDSLPDYDTLDAILALHIDQHQTAAEIAAQGFDPATVNRVCSLVKGAEFKRRQAAPGIKIAQRSFGTGWRMPLACKRMPQA